ncbi:30S ribosomal protein S12 methylthiotransferase RimO [candidate division KSB1 bacterium]|nr:30S ribosomal protein S12 methylthiotransferase RimO [candidate division KSB1 bacterium]
MKISLITLGCPKNIVDSEWLLGALAGPDIELVNATEQAEVIIINTCGFIQSAKEEAIETIFEAIQQKENGKCRKVLVTGCLVARYLEELEQEIPEVDGFYSNRDLPLAIKNIAQSLNLSNEKSRKRILLTPKHYAYLKIAEGCNNCCSYCAIPLIRGNMKSFPFEAIIQEAQQLVKNGVQELLVIAQDTTQYGVDRKEDKRLVDLLQRLVQIEALKWVRLMYTHPAHYSDDLIDFIAEQPKICKYLDLPIQHISDRILKKMRRKVNRQQIEALIAKLRTKIPELALRTSVIVGFPGESVAEFDELLDFISSIKFERLGAFAYSPEEGTPAYEFSEQIVPSIQQERLEQIMEVQSQISFEHNSSLIDTVQQVLVDEYDSYQQKFLGRTQWDAPEIDNVVWIENSNVEQGRFYPVQISKTYEFDLYGQVI